MDIRRVEESYDMYRLTVSRSELDTVTNGLISAPGPEADEMLHGINWYVDHLPKPGQSKDDHKAEIEAEDSTQKPDVDLDVDKEVDDLLSGAPEAPGEDDEIEQEVERVHHFHTPTDLVRLGRNCERIAIAKEALDMFDLVIIDEAAVYRNPSTKRFKQFYRWLQVQQDMRLWLMTGTPTPNEPTDAWALAKLVDSPHMTKSFTGFREQVMMKLGQWKFVPRPESVDIVKHVLQPSIRFTREDCLDLPDTITQTRKVDMTPEQAKHFKQMLRQLVTEAAGGTITAVNEAVKAQKLIQIALGVAYGENGELIELDCKPRINAVREVIEEAGEKVILFVPLTGTLRMLERELSKEWTVAVVNGEVSSAKRNEIFHKFQHAKDPRILIAHPATMAHGLTLTAASTVVWYGPITSNEQYVQANGRVERIGKKHVSNVVHIEATEVEHRIYTRLQNKQKLQGVLLDLIAQMGKD